MALPEPAAPTLADIDLIATDLDGTLLKREGRSVSAEAFGQIRELVGRGCKFFAASGRQYASLRRLFAPVADEIGYVCENGALAIYRGEVVHKHALPHADAMRIAHLVIDHPDCDVILSGELTCYAMASSPQWFVNDLVENMRNDVTVLERPEDVTEPVIKIAFRVPGGKCPEIEAYMQERVGDGYRVVTSGASWIDLISDGVDKGRALVEVGRHLGIDPARMAAFGDEMNDVEMLGVVGHPYVMDTGNPALLARYSRALTCSYVEDEFARLLAGDGAPRAHAGGCETGEGALR